MQESRLQREILLAASQYEGLVLWRNNSGVATHFHNGQTTYTRYGVGGTGGADLIGCYRGRFIALELKSPKGKVRPEQIEFRKQVRYAGGICETIRSVEEFHEVMR